MANLSLIFELVEAKSAEQVISILTKRLRAGNVSDEIAMTIADALDPKGSGQWRFKATRKSVGTPGNFEKKIAIDAAVQAYVAEGKPITKARELVAAKHKLDPRTILKHQTTLRDQKKRSNNDPSNVG
jgi:hypothetical protein